MVIIMKKLGLATALLLAMTGAQAYQYEVQGQSEFVDAKEAHKNFTGAVAGTYYLNNVDSSKGPLAEAAFLNQASNVSAAYNYGELKVTDAPRLTSQSYGVKGEAYIPTSVVPVYASASYNHTYTDVKGSSEKDNGDRYALEVGAMIAPNFLVAAGYTSVNTQASLDASSILSKGVIKAALESDAIGDKKDVITARTKYVGAIDGTNMSLGFDAGLVYGEDTAYNLGTTLYLNPALSVGVSYVETSTDLDAKAWGAHVNYFITPAIAVGVDYVNATTNETALNAQSVGVNAKFRF